MSEQGENIVRLAKALLNSETPIPSAPASVPVRKSATSPDFWLKPFIYMALLAIMGICFLVYDQTRPISHYEYVELNALIFYAASNTQKDIETIKNQAMEAVKITDYNALSQKDFIKLRNFLRSHSS